MVSTSVELVQIVKTVHLDLIPLTSTSDCHSDASNVWNHHHMRLLFLWYLVRGVSGACEDETESISDGGTHSA